jgi:hypothetical protein
VKRQKGAGAMEETNTYPVCLQNDAAASYHDTVQVKDIDDLIFAGEPVKLHSEK